MTTFQYGDCSSKCAKSLIRIIKEAIDEIAVIQICKIKNKKGPRVNNNLKSLIAKRTRLKFFIN